MCARVLRYPCSLTCRPHAPFLLTPTPPHASHTHTPTHTRLHSDTLFSADLTIMEEGYELLHRLSEHLDGHPDKDEPMPMFTSCCPGWVGELNGGRRQGRQGKA